ncbi:spore protease YyaC [Paenibacillus pinihumi]|uniref:spore protease YyaC n=1 Tax=Paenibacillus pinihumi TaxID=669462 RepID=UPI0013773774|nr:spore protease YyaC [Paenibacillus pinihumi]
MDLISEIKNKVQNIPAEQITFFCIGTDRSTGDSFGPLIGSALYKLGYNVIGRMDDLVHAMNLDERIKEIPEGRKVIAIDSCLGRADSIGDIRFRSGPCRPGAGVGKQLTPIGDYHLIGIVNAGGFMEYFVLQNTPLHRVMNMAKSAVDAICNAVLIPAIAEVATTNQINAGSLKRSELEEMI